MNENRRAFFERAADGCHKLGWVINLVVMVLLFAYFIGQMQSALESTKERLTRIENVLDRVIENQLNHADNPAAK